MRKVPIILVLIFLTLFAAACGDSDSADSEESSGRINRARAVAIDRSDANRDGSDDPDRDNTDERDNNDEGDSTDDPENRDERSDEEPELPRTDDTSRTSDPGDRDEEIRDDFEDEFSDDGGFGSVSDEELADLLEESGITPVSPSEARCFWDAIPLDADDATSVELGEAFDCLNDQAVANLLSGELGGVQLTGQEGRCIVDGLVERDLEDLDDDEALVVVGECGALGRLIEVQAAEIGVGLSVATVNCIDDEAARVNAQDVDDVEQIALGCLTEEETAAIEDAVGSFEDMVSDMDDTMDGTLMDVCYE